MTTLIIVKLVRMYKQFKIMFLIDKFNYYTYVQLGPGEI